MQTTKFWRAGVVLSEASLEGAAVVLLTGILAACSVDGGADPASGGASSASGAAGAASSGAGTHAGGGGAGGQGGQGGSLASSGGASAGTGGMANAGAAGSSGASGGKSGATGVVCEGSANNPRGLEVGVWTNITPPDPMNPGEEDHDFVNDVQFDPSNPSTVYALNRGVEKSTDGGSTWTNISTFWLPQRIRIDPNDQNHLLTIQGVHASGFYATTNGGASWETPAGFTAILPQIGNDTDMYGLEVDPTDFGHFLLTFHWYWDGCADGCKSGVVECFDGGATCTARDPIPGVTGNGGHNAFFLSNPAQGVGDSNSWIFMTQPGGGGEGYWRTTNAGTSWTLASEKPMIHGGSQLYYASTGTLYAAAWDALMKSTDNGVSWTQARYGGLFAVQGDGENLFVIESGGGKLKTAPETNDSVWTDYNEHSFAHGASNLVYEPCNHILYAAMREDGAWALKLE